MNHDYAHCLDWKKDCPETCFRAQLTKDARENPQLQGIPLTWTHFKNTVECGRKERQMSDLISRQAVLDAVSDCGICIQKILDLPSAEPEGYVQVPETGIDDLSDGYHTFRQLYYQRMMLFATIVKQNKEKAWKSLRHEDGELCFGGGWFIVGVDTPKGSYTYHYEDNYFSLFDCEELACGKHWDGHTEKDVTRLLSLPTAKHVRHGKWIDIDEQTYTWKVRCSCCGHERSIMSTQGKYPNYCEACGARMDEE